jgi:hypothetical protein
MLPALIIRFIFEQLFLWTASTASLFFAVSRSLLSLHIMSSIASSPVILTVHGRWKSRFKKPGRSNSLRSMTSLFLFTTIQTKQRDENTDLLFYYPPTTPINDQLTQVGLAQTLITLNTQLVTDSTDIQFITTTKHRIACFSPEDGYWIFLVRGFAL